MNNLKKIFFEIYIYILPSNIYFTFQLVELKSNMIYGKALKTVLMLSLSVLEKIRNPLHILYSCVRCSL